MKVSVLADLHHVGDRAVAMNTQWCSLHCRRSNHDQCSELFPVGLEWMTCACDCHGTLQERLARLPALMEAVTVPGRKARSKDGRPCGCECGGTTKGGSFLPGHDARYRSALTAIAREGGPDAEAARDKARSRGWQI